MRRTHFPSATGDQSGVVLPMALIMLVIISFAGLMAARNSATFEQFSNNMRTNQVARVSAEDALRRCERIAITKVANETNPAVVLLPDTDKIYATEIADDTDAEIKAGLWNTKTSWADEADNLITITPSYGDQVQDDDEKNPRLKNPPTCIIQAMVNDRFLVTARGLSNDAVVDDDTGELTEGSEVWLQSILTPGLPLMGPNGGEQ